MSSDVTGAREFGFENELNRWAGFCKLKLTGEHFHIQVYRQEKLPVALFARTDGQAAGSARRTRPRIRNGGGLGAKPAGGAAEIYSLPAKKMRLGFSRSHPRNRGRGRLAERRALETGQGGGNHYH